MAAVAVPRGAPQRTTTRAIHRTLARELGDRILIDGTYESLPQSPARFARAVTHVRHRLLPDNTTLEAPEILLENETWWQKRVWGGELKQTIFSIVNE